MTMGSGGASRGWSRRGISVNFIRGTSNIWTARLQCDQTLMLSIPGNTLCIPVENTCRSWCTPSPVDPEACLSRIWWFNSNISHRKFNDDKNAILAICDPSFRAPTLIYCHTALIMSGLLAVWRPSSLDSLLVNLYWTGCGKETLDNRNKLKI